jgi:hypothetical protein
MNLSDTKIQIIILVIIAAGCIIFFLNKKSNVITSPSNTPSRISLRTPSVTPSRTPSVTSPPSQDCKVGDWSDWVCDRTTGIKTRTRSVTQNPLYGGRPCPPLNETGECPRDCKVGDWSDWVCDRTSGIKTRTRPVISESLRNGNSCPPLNETGECPRDCKLGEWSNWSCEYGIEKRERQVILQPLRGGNNDCQNKLVDFRQKSCREGDIRNGSDCYEKCPNGWRDVGMYCMSGNNTIDKKIYNICNA